jgi:hypothetical protein
MENRSLSSSLALTDQNWNLQVESFKQANSVVRKVLQEDIDFGKIPGTQKPTLYKSGAEKMARFFQIHVEYDVDQQPLGNGHFEYIVDCVVKTNSDSMTIGNGTGSCNTRESKYLYRKKERVCPVCGKEAIIAGKKEYGGGWICFQKKGGCNAKFSEGSKEIEDQETGYVEYENPADYYNTCRKMAKKRAYVDAIITTLGLDMSQDLEDVLENLFKYSEAKTGEETDDFSEIKKALDSAGIPRDKFSAWLKKSYGKDVETVSVLKTDKEKILKTIKENPTEIMV